MGTFLSSVALQWLLRRVLDWGGWLGTFLLGIIGFYNALPPEAQAAVAVVFSGQWQDITIGSLIPLAALVWSQVQSFRSTVKPQIVLDGQQVDLKDMPAQKSVVVQEYARTALDEKKRTALDRLLDKLNRR